MAHSDWIAIKAQDIDSHVANLSEYQGWTQYYDPNVCPICGSKIAPRLLGALNKLINGSEKQTFHFYQCTDMTCREAFVATYIDDGAMHPNRNKFRTILKPVDVFPKIPKLPDIDEDIHSLSPSFAEIYSEAFAAEQYGLNQICGPGYRKSLEFLVKDYAIRRYPDDIDSIKAALLSPCIKKYIDHPVIKETAEKATWIGNDETHYVRKWNKHDVQDLKSLISATTAFIKLHLQTENMLKSFEREE